MSVEKLFVLRDDRLPTIHEWQAALDRANSGIVLEDVGDLRNYSGYLPVTHHGHPSGFEWYYWPVDDEFFDDEDELGDRTHVIDCVTHSDLREYACGLIACAILAQAADGLFYDDESNQVVPPAIALEKGRRIGSELGSEVRRTF
jgi:hypothetical protein